MLWASFSHYVNFHHRPVISYYLFPNIFLSIQAWFTFNFARQSLIFLIGIVGGGVQLGPLGTAATSRPVVPAPGDYDDGEIGGMIGRGNRSTRRKPAPMPLCPPQTPHATRTRTQTPAVGSQRLTAWATARPLQDRILKSIIFHVFS
jgi:hypothetical protein